MAVTGISLATSLGINGGICIICFLIFSCLRVAPLTRKFYMPKRFDSEVKRKPKRLGLGLLSWIKPVILYPEDQILKVAGMDVVVMNRLLVYGLTLFAFCTLWCCAVLMPINGTAGYLPSVPSQPNGQPGVIYSDLDIISASNIGPRDSRFWAHLITAYVVSIVALALLQAFSNDVSRLRARYISTIPRGGPSHSVLVTDIPCVDGVGALPGVGAVRRVADKMEAHLGKAREKIFTDGDAKDVDAEAGSGVAAPSSSVDAHDDFVAIEDSVLDPWENARNQLAQGDVPTMVRDEMQTIYGAQGVAAVNVVADTRKVEPVLAKYDATKGKLEDITNDIIGKLKRKEQHKIKRKQVTLLPAITPQWAKDKYHVAAKSVKVDALEYLPQELEHLYQQLVQERDAAAGSYLPAAFITFNDRFSANTAANGLQTYDETAWRVQPAPGDDEIVWPNLAMRYRQRVARAFVMLCLFVAILIFYLPVTAAIQAVVNLDNVRAVPGLGLVTRIPFVTQVLQGILPSLVLKIFLILLPPILTAMAKFQGMTSVSQIDFSIVNRYYIFQVFATLIYQFLVGSALANLAAILANPGIIVGLLGVSAAQQANFFMTYIMINALAIGFGLIRVVPLILYFIKIKLAGTERARYRLWAKQEFTFGTNVANHTIILLLGLAFTWLTPLIAPFALLYFVLALLAQKYQLIYVVTLPYKAAGRMWIDCFHQIMVGIYFLQAMVLCVLLVKRFEYCLLILPLVVGTIIFHIVNINLYKRPWTLMSLKEAALLDARDPEQLSPEEAEELRLKYLSPVFKVDLEEHARIIQEATQVDKQLKGEATALNLDDEPATSNKMTDDDA